MNQPELSRSRLVQHPSIRPKLIAVDVDDTLLEADLTLSDACAEALKSAQAAGVNVVIATGRMFRSALPFALRLGIDRYLIAYNGALIRTIAGETVWHKPVPAQYAREMIGVAREMGFRLNFYIDDTLVVDGIDERVEYYLQIAKVEPQVVDDLAGALDRGEPTKCLFVGDADEVAAAVPKLQARFPELQISRSKPRFIEVTRRGIRKEVAVAKVAELYGIGMEDVMAIGDGDNDVTMLQRAGVGVAVANASDKAKAAADVVTGGARGAGVREAVERFVLGA